MNNKPSISNSVPHSVSPCLRVERRGMTLITLMTGIFVGALVLGACVPMFLAAQRDAEIGMVQAQMREEAREIAGHFREDVRQAIRVEITSGGARLNLTRERSAGHGAQVVYSGGDRGLLRMAHSGAAAQSDERQEWAAPASRGRFARQGRAVTLTMNLSRAVRGRLVRLEIPCSATPRSAL